MKYSRIASVCAMLICSACDNISDVKSGMIKIDATIEPAEIEHDYVKTKSTFNKSFNFVWTVDDKIGVSSVGKTTFTSFIIQNGYEGKKYIYGFNIFKSYLYIICFIFFYVLFFVS